jgi:predicted MFS family arabinose efflux permease
MLLQRNRLFWTIALQTAVANFYLGGFGPAQPLLRSEQHTSLTIAGLHGTAMGVASIFAGFVNAKLVHRFGRTSTAWLGMALLSTGVLIFVFSPPVSLTLVATLIAGFGTSMIINSSVTQLSHHFPENPTGAVSQANAISSVGYVFGTIAVGTLASTTLSWRLGLLIVIPVGALLYQFFGRGNVGQEHIPDLDGPQRGSLKPQFWIAWFGFIACISSEFTTTFWAAALVRDRVGSSAAISTISLVAVGSGMGIGRWFGPSLLKRNSVDAQLKAIVVTQFLGFATLWFSHRLWISIASLFVVGLGLSMQFALLSLRLIGFSDGRPDLAIGRSSLAVGIAIAGAPFMLGVLGDHLGISRAYLMVPVLIVITLTSIIAVPSSQSKIQDAE